MTLSAPQVQERLESASSLAHAVYVGYMSGIGLQTKTWDELSEQYRERLRDGVKAILEGSVTSPAESHANWLRWMSDAGWTFGPVLLATEKQHPCMVAFDELKPIDQVKDSLFVAAVRAAAILWEEARSAGVR